MKVRFTRQAFRDRERIFAYIAERSPSGAAKVMNRIRSVIDRLALFPESGYPTNVEGVRLIFVGRYTYRIFYRVRNDAIEILHIRHTSRRPTELE